jgi:regulation of enolase protein 1 (concanavalin A-like superfamily)
MRVAIAGSAALVLLVAFGAFWFGWSQFVVRQRTVEISRQVVALAAAEKTSPLTGASDSVRDSLFRVEAGLLGATLLVTDDAGAVERSSDDRVSVQALDLTRLGAADAGGVRSATVAGGTYAVTGGGADIWGSSDQFHFVYQPLSGDGEIVARVVSVQNADVWSKAGVMMRESVAANARHAMMVVTPGAGTAFQRRTTAGGASAHTSGPSVAAPYWVRLVRTGATVTASTSANGSTWTTVGSVSLSLPTSALVGLAVTAANNSLTATAVFDSVTVVP